jgi:RNA polymerase primary sigma factor
MSEATRPFDAREEAAHEDLVRQYLREIGQYSLLTDIQEVELAKAIEDGEKAAEKLDRARKPTDRQRRQLQAELRTGRQAKRRFIQSNLRLVVSIAKKYSAPGLPLIDLIQEGNLGLMRAIEKFDYQRGFKFSTYATWWIRQAVTRAIADKARTIRIPVHVADQVRKVTKTRRLLGQKLNRDPSLEEIAADSGVPEPRIRQLLELIEETVSLETPVGDGESLYGDMIQDTKTAGPDAETADRLRAVELAAALDCLNPRMRHVLAQRFGLDGAAPQTLEEVGAGLGITRERVRQLEARALRELRAVAPGLEFYLRT